MRQVQSVEDVYPALDDVVVELRAAGTSQLAGVLHHRMHQVSWTSRSELFGELQRVLTEALEADAEKLPRLLEQQIERVLRVMQTFLDAADA